MQVHYTTSSAGRISLAISKKIIQGAASYLLNERIPVEVCRKRFERVNALSRLPAGVKLFQTEYGGIPVEVLDPEMPNNTRTVLYCHGGGFCIGSPKTHRELTAWLAKTLGVRVVVPDYRLAPDHPYPAAPDDVMTVYLALLARGIPPNNLVLMGDSAGGNLAMVTLLRLKALEKPMPAAAVLYSPWLDLRCVSESYATKNTNDPVLSGAFLRRMREYYCAGKDLTDPDISPVLGDVSGFPPMLIHVGSDEILLNDSLLFARHVKEQRGDIRVAVWENLWHVFQTQVEFFEPARQSLRETRDFINRTLVNS